MTLLSAIIVQTRVNNFYVNTCLSMSENMQNAGHLVLRKKKNERKNYQTENILSEYFESPKCYKVRNVVTTRYFIALNSLLEFPYRCDGFSDEVLPKHMLFKNILRPYFSIL